MLRRRAAVSLLLLVTAVPPVHPQIPTELQADIRTVGSASQALRPDLATVLLEFSRDGATPTQANLRVGALADSLRRALQALGIPRDSLISAQRGYWGGRGRLETTYPSRFVPAPNGPPGAGWQKQDTVFRAHEAIQVRLRELAKIGSVIDTALSYGITQVSNVEFAATNTGKSRNEALRLATIDARDQAQAMAEASGSRLGRLLSLTTQADLPYDPRGPLMAARAAVDGGPTQVVAPQVRVSVTVFARWELLPQ